MTANLAIAFSKFGRRVLMVDADLPMPNLNMFAGLKEMPVTLYDVLARKKPVESAVYKVYGGADIMPCGTSLESFLKADIRRIKNVIDAVRKIYEYVLVDTSSGLNKYNLNVLKVSDEVIWVVNPDEPSMSDTLRLKTAADIFNVKTRGMIVNKVPSFSWSERRKAPKVKKSDLEAKLGCGVLGVIPESSQVKVATLVQKSVIEYSPKGPVTKAFRELARVLLTQDSGVSLPQKA
ncbi:MAG: hypothetical protein DRI32_05740 [Chloroflexi bacterium]|nr:MAG: hypothetical protein DRI32_05740 [Chloroflexota bacterium]